MELSGTILKSNNEKRLVFGAVLVPNEPDADGDIVTAEKIEEVSYKFMESYGNIDIQHTLNNVGKVVESFITRNDMHFDGLYVPKGSWMMGVKVQDESTWQLVKSGKLTGFSIMGVRKSKIAEKSNEPIALKRTTLTDLGADWIVTAVSLVDEPAVPKAKFVAIKSKESIFDRLKKIFSSDKEGKVTLGGGEMKEELKAIVKEAFSEVKTEEEAKKKETEKAEKEKQAQTEENKGDSKELEVLKSKIAKLEELQENYKKLEEENKQLKEAAEKALQLINSGSRRMLRENAAKSEEEEMKPTRDAFGRRIF